MTYFKVGYYSCIRLESLGETKKRTSSSDPADSGLHIPSTSPKYITWAELETLGPLEEQDFVLANKMFHKHILYSTFSCNAQSTL
jgi:hypothetical protein